MILKREQPQWQAAVRGTSSTNRCATGEESSIHIEPQVLVDTIAVTGEISSHRLSSTRQREDLNRRTGEVKYDFMSAETYLAQDVPLRIRAHNEKLSARMEFSVPNYLHGGNVHATPLTEALAVVKDLHRQASDVVEWETPAAKLRVSRIDLPRDFEGITDFDHLLDGLGRLHVPRTTVNQRYGDGATGEAQTLRRGVTRSWTVTAYNKGAEIAHQARHERDPERRAYLHRQAERYQGRLRVEPSLRAPYLRRKGLTTVADCTEDLLADLRHGAFTRARLDVAVGGAPHLLDVLRHLTVTDPVNCKFWPSVLGTLYAEAHGLPCPVSGKTAKRDRGLARSWGISAADMSEVAGSPVILDYYSGSLRAAA